MDLKKESLYAILDLISEPAILVDELGKIIFENKSAKTFCSNNDEGRESCFDVAEKILQVGMNEGQLKVKLHDRVVEIHFKIVKLHGFAFLVFSDIEKRIKELSDKLIKSTNELESINEELTSAEEEAKRREDEIRRKNIDFVRSEEKYKALAETSSDIIVIVDEKYLVKYVNSSALSYFKGSRENVIGKSIKQLFPYDDEKQKTALIDMVFKEKKQMKFDSVTVFPDGEVWLGTRLVPLFDSEKKVESVMMISRDITERKRIELDNLTVNERFGKVFKHNPLGILISRAEDGHIIDANDSCEAIFGYPPEELLGRPAGILYEKPEERAFFVDRLLREGPQKNYELKIRRKNNEIRTVFLSADYLEINEERCILSIIQDVTEEVIANNTREVLFDIADSAFRVKDLSSLYPEIHKSLKKVLNANNFYVAVYEKSSDTINFPYYHDEKDDYAPSKKFGNGLTEYALKNKKPVLLSGEEIKKMAENGIVEIIGTLPVQWLGVPLLGESFTGVLAVQHYDVNYSYTQNDKNILYFVSKQISRGIENKVKEELLIQSELKHRMLLDSIKSPILSLREDMEIFYCNQSYADFVGKKLSDLEGKNLLEIFPDFEKTKSFEAFKKCMKTGETQQVEGEVKGKNVIINARIYRTKWGILSVAESMAKKSS
ncbi:MAG: PAS domain S-box protein [bacterium]|nr:PAS domain S-box protein [bacterium]